MNFFFNFFLPFLFNLTFKLFCKSKGFCNSMIFSSIWENFSHPKRSEKVSNQLSKEKWDFLKQFLVSKAFFNSMLCEKLESGKLLQFIVFQTFDSKLLFLKLNYGSRTREGNENVRDQSSCQISGNLGLTCLQEKKKKKRGWGASFFVAGNSTLLMHASLVFFSNVVLQLNLDIGDFWSNT